jgi:nitroreductase
MNDRFTLALILVINEFAQERAERYVHIEAGSIAENVYLQGIALGIGTVIIGAFNDEGVKSVLQLPEDEHPLAIMPLGKMPKTAEQK